MLSSNVIWVAFGCYIVFLLSVAYYVTRKEKRAKSTGNMNTAKVSAPGLIMTYAASLMSTWVFFAGPGAYSRGGIGYWISEMSYIALFPLVAHFSMNKVWIINREKGHSFETPADFYYERYRSKLLTFILGCIFLSASLPYVTSVLVAIANAAQYATGGHISYRLAVFVVGLTMTIFVCIGGVKSAALADTVQGILFILMLWVIALACLGVGFGGSLPKAVTHLYSNTPEFFSYPGPGGWTTYGSRFGYPFSCAIGWTIMLPHVFVRSGYFGDNLKTQRRLSFYTPIIQAVVWTGCMLIGLIGLSLAPGLKSSVTELIIPYLVKHYVLKFSSGLAAFLMVGFFLGANAVGLSTANAFLSVSSAMVKKDILQVSFGMNINKNNQNEVTRIIILILGISSTLMALNPPGLIFTLIMFAIAMVMPLFPILMFGIYWKRATKEAAIISAIVGTVLVLLTYTVWNVGNTYYGAFGLIGSTITMIVVSLLTKERPEDSKEFYQLLDKGHQRYYDVQE